MCKITSFDLDRATLSDLAEDAFQLDIATILIAHLDLSMSSTTIPIRLDNSNLIRFQVSVILFPRRDLLV